MLDEALKLCSDVDIAIRISKTCRTANIDDVLMERKRMPDSKSLGKGSRMMKCQSYKIIYDRHGCFLRERFGRMYLSREIHGWGKYLMSEGRVEEARRCFLRSFIICPWHIRNYKKIIKLAFRPGPKEPPRHNQI